MTEIWSAIRTRLSALGWHALLADLRAPALPGELAALREEAGLDPPAHLTASLQIHDGGAGRYRLIDPWDLLPASVIAEKRRFMHGDFAALLAKEGVALRDGQEGRGPVRPIIWNDHGWPFADDGTGNLLCVDDDPAEGGTHGQVILWSADPPFVEVIAGDLREFFECYHAGLAGEAYAFSEVDGVSQQGARRIPLAHITERVT